MKILLLTQVVPYPPDSGPKVKTYHVLRYLAEQGHQITLVSFVRDYEKKYLDNLRPYCAAIEPVAMRRSRFNDGIAYLASLRAGLPFLITRDDLPAMRQLIARLAQQPFDIVHADQLTMAQFALRFRTMARSIAGKTPATVFDAHNAVYEIVERTRQTALPFLRPILGLEAQRLKQYEARLLEQFDQVLAVSEIDKRALLNAANGSKNAEPLASKIAVIPIAVDNTSSQVKQRHPEPNHILTIGTLFYPPNADGVRWFVKQVFPLIQNQIPNVTLSVVGPRPPQDLIDLSRQQPHAIQVTGYVPDLQPYFERAAVAVVPVRVGSGMRVRILETMARGVPIVTTSTGVEGIDAIDGEHLLVADEPAKFAMAVERVLKNPALGETLVCRSRQLVQEKYDWRVVLPALETIYAKLDAK